MIQQFDIGDGVYRDIYAVTKDADITGPFLLLLEKLRVVKMLTTSGAIPSGEYITIDYYLVV